MSLTSEQAEFVLDYFFRCSELEESAKGSELIASNLEAAKLYDALKRAFSHLDHLEKEECPGELVALTLARLNLLKAAVRTRPQDRLK